MKFEGQGAGEEAVCPTPQGVGGLKFVKQVGQNTPEESHPTRGGWIEILLIRYSRPGVSSHPTRGGWIEMASSSTQEPSFCPTPQGVGGLKYYWKSKNENRAKVPPHKGWVD